MVDFLLELDSKGQMVSYCTLKAQLRQALESSVEGKYSLLGFHLFTRRHELDQEY